MHEKDCRKLLKFGFILYRCSEVEKVIKVRTMEDSSWKLLERCKTKKRVQEAHAALLKDAKAIQV